MVDGGVHGVCHPDLRHEHHQAQSYRAAIISSMVAVVIEKRHTLMRSLMSVGISFVRLCRCLSLVRRFLMCSMHAPIGTEGNKAVASNEYILSVGASIRFLIVWTK